MKKFLTIFVGLFLFAVILSAQNRPVLSTYTVQLDTTLSGNIDLNVMPSLDYLSLQIIPTSVSGDSLDFSYAPYFRNTYTGVWNKLMAVDTVSGTTAALVSADTDAYLYYSPFKYLQLRLVCTGISHDTVLVTVHALQK